MSDSATPRWRRERWRAGGLICLTALVGSLALAGCDVPTGVPKWDTTWMVPARNVSLGVGQFLPSSVTVTPDSSAFQVQLTGLPFVETLGAMCGAPCYAASGQTVPKPAFDITVSQSQALPGSVQSATMASTPVTLVLKNGLTFDPIRPSATARGKIVITFMSGGVTLGSTTISGTATAFAPGQTLTRSVAMTGTVTDSVTTRVEVDSPAGDPALIQPADGITFDVQNVRLAQVTANVGTRSVSQGVSLGLGNIDPVVLNHLASGSLLLDIHNPYPITGKLNVVIAGPSTPQIVKPLGLSSGDSQASLNYTAAELHSFLGQPGVTLTVQGNVTATGPVTFTPRQSASVDSRLEVVLGPQG